jgi:NTP pyrophosphatase (non-canonical NTP hydrolase)
LSLSHDGWRRLGFPDRREADFRFLEESADMDMAELSEKMDQFVRAQGWYAPGSPKPQTARNLAISLAIEAAEVLEHFQWQEQPADRDALAAELADVALYLLQIASVSGIDLERAILQKLDVNAARKWKAEQPGGGEAGS